MLPYKKLKEMFPPRPANAIPSTSIIEYDNGEFLAQPKLNGSNCSIYMDGKTVLVLNRHKERMTNFQITNEELLELYTLENGEWMVINGEYLNKAKKGEDGKLFNHKLIIFDILVYTKYLIGRTFEQRVWLLDELFGKEDSELTELYNVKTTNNNVYRVKTYEIKFTEAFNRLIPTDVYEGIVMKRKNARLERGLTANNNINSQLKSRKPTKNYQF